MKRAALVLLVVPLIALWLYGCDKVPVEPETGVVESTTPSGPSFAKGGKPKPPELPTDCTDGQSIKWDAGLAAWECSDPPDISFWYRSGTAPAYSTEADITGCYDQRVGGGYWADEGLQVAVMSPDPTRAAYDTSELEGPDNQTLNMYYEFTNPTDTPLTYTVYAICMDDPR